jgi:hypothetical protein
VRIAQPSQSNMPHYLIKEKNRTSTLVYEAPVDEKTKEIRKMFDVDEETGYPRAYNWRPLARLGPNYRPEKVYEVIEPYKPEQKLTTNVALVASTAFIVGSVHYFYQKYHARPLWSKPLRSLAIFGVFSTALVYGFEYKLQRDQLKNQIYADYMKKHPERFETVHRPKFREVLFQYTPVR